MDQVVIWEDDFQVKSFLEKWNRRVAWQLHFSFFF